MILDREGSEFGEEQLGDSIRKLVEYILTDSCAELECDTHRVMRLPLSSASGSRPRSLYAAGSRTQKERLGWASIA